MRLIVDVDGTLTHDESHLAYDQKRPRLDVIARINALHDRGVTVVLYSARNMRTYKGNLGCINKHTLPVLLPWLDRHGVSFDEIYLGKPWCGTEGFYVHPRGIRPDDFVSLDMSEIENRLGFGSGASDPR